MQDPPRQILLSRHDAAPCVSDQQQSESAVQVPAASPRHVVDPQWPSPWHARPKQHDVFLLQFAAKAEQALAWHFPPWRHVVPMQQVSVPEHVPPAARQVPARHFVLWRHVTPLQQAWSPVLLLQAPVVELFTLHWPEPQ